MWADHVGPAVFCTAGPRGLPHGPCVGKHVGPLRVVRGFHVGCNCGLYVGSMWVVIFIISKMYTVPFQNTHYSVLSFISLFMSVNISDGI